MVEDKTGDEQQLITCKVVPHREQRKIRHDTYRKLINNKIKQVFVRCSNIRSKNFNVYTTHTTKVGLTDIDIKRYYINNKSSVAYDHPNYVNMNQNEQSTDDDVES